MIVGHRQIRRILQNQVNNGRLSHAYLFWGPAGIGKMLVAGEFAKALLCLDNREGVSCGTCDSCRLIDAGNHPDLQLVGPEREGDGKSARVKEIGIAAVRQTIGFCGLKPILAFRKVVIVNDAQYLTDQAQNAFLKSLEEPQNTIFIIVAENPDNLLETVRSRCRKIKFLSLNFENFQKAVGSEFSLAELKELFVLCAGRPGLALNLKEAGGQSELERQKEEFMAVFKKGLWERYKVAEILAKDEERLLAAADMWRVLARDLIMARLGMPDRLINQSIGPAIVKEAGNLQLEKLLKIFKLLNFLVSSVKNTNFNPRLALDMVMTEV